MCRYRRFYGASSCNVAAVGLLSRLGVLRMLGEIISVLVMSEKILG
ncbi:unnamed protein product [Chondrus crispus]|uniref:Uncharacterized protein n=1 Tax=Chondrus crispus TaxID=2769 RepID=R7QEM5_CHOCR|nr:unnamed protein product [Chondrus crispus]CDF35880.1 unnamed protein product [Chondrus crispus]|eukprot:XP_005715699.1 unnamed protein product [Chondrus crispus]